MNEEKGNEEARTDRDECRHTSNVDSDRMYTRGAQAGRLHGRGVETIRP